MIRQVACPIDDSFEATLGRDEKAIHRYYVQMKVSPYVKIEKMDRTKTAPLNAPNVTARRVNATRVSYHTLFQLLSIFSWSFGLVPSLEVRHCWSATIELIPSVPSSFELWR